MKFAPVLALAAAALAVTGCTPSLTLEEAQAQCTKQGGLLVIIYTQKFTRARMGPVVASPGDCVSPDRFLQKNASGANPVPPGNAPATPAAPANSPPPSP